MTRLFVASLFCFLAFTQTANAQILDSFSVDNRAFINEMKDFLTANKQKVVEDLFDTFSDQVDAGVFTPEDLTVIRNTSNSMLSKRMSANPNFKAYFEALVLVKNDANGAQRFTDWHTILNAMLDNMETRKYKPYQLFLEFSTGFFDRKSFRSTTTGMNWYADSDQLEMLFENGEPVIRFSEFDLYGVRGKDSILISNAVGDFFPAQEIFKGKSGRVTWERNGLPADVYSELGAYEIEVKKSLYSVGTAKLHYPQFFGDQLVSGKFEDKVSNTSGANVSSYPRFETDDARVEIEEIGPGISYEGGFRLQGTTVYGVGSSDNPASIIIRRPDNSMSFRGSCELFTIRRGELIVGDQVNGTVYFGQDSLYHPSVNIRFQIEKRQLELSRGNRASDKNPFFSSMHQINLEADKINYYMDGDSMLIGEKTLNISKRNTPVVFESLQFFSENDYYRFQNISTYNPIAVIRAVADKDGRVLNADYLAERIDSRFSVENIQTLLYDLVEKGFVDYDAHRNEVIVKDKIFHYVNASQKNVDYDVLRIESESKETNAVFLPGKEEMTIEGVDYIEFSQTQKVAVNPYGGQVELGRNRNIGFDGRLYAGLTTLDGKDFHFEYDPYHIIMDSVRYFNMFFLSDSLDTEGNQVGLSLGSRIEHLNGVLLIDAPANKAGLEDIPLFPSLNSKSNSFVYYDFIEGFKGAYKRDSFYFELEPFSLNGLDKYKRTDISFKGNMVSAGIFPDFKETLVIRGMDQSLGFVSDTPEEGYPAYGGKGKYVGAIDLSNQGLLGQGTLTYLGANIASEDIVFQPELTTGSAREFFMAEVRNGGVEVPQAKGIDVSLEWRPYKDSMYIYSQEAPFEIFPDGIHNLEGTLVLTPTGLKGKGLFNWDKADMRSSLFSFGAHRIQADTTNLRIKAFDSEEELAMVTENLNGSIDFDTGIASFKGNGDFLVSELPFNQYKTSMRSFEWDINEERVSFLVDPGEKGRFLSIHPDQDSLRFEWETTTFNLKTNDLDIDGVDYIVSADAYIYPEDGKIKIGPGGRMDSIYNARIVADTVSQYHVINRATIQILGRKDFLARGFYEYNIGDRKQEIEFQDIIGERVGKGNRRTKPVATRANGIVNPEDRFYIDTKTEYRGKIQLSSDRPELHFSGFARFDSNLPNPHWFSVDFDGDKRDLSIEFTDPLNYEGERLVTGLFLSKETARIYPRVMAPLYFRKDRPICQVKGLFNYDDERDHFIFADSLKMVEEGRLQGNKLVYQNGNGKVDVEGKIIIGDGLKYISVESAGKLSTDIHVISGDSLSGPITNSIVSGELMVGVNLILPDELLRALVNDFQSSSFDANPVVYAGDANFFMKAATELFENNQDVRQAIAGVTLNDFAIPQKFNKYTFLFPKIPVKWDPDYQSFISMKTILPLASINGEVFNRNVTAYMECKMPLDGDDRLYVYLKSPSGFYYFFGFKQGIMNVVSDNTKFNDLVINMKEKDRIYKMDDGNTYEIQPVNPSTASAFLRRVEAAQ